MFAGAYRKICPCIFLTLVLPPALVIGDSLPILGQFIKFAVDWT